MTKKASYPFQVHVKCNSGTKKMKLNKSFQPLRYFYLL